MKNEIKKLRERLAETEEIIRVLRSGEIDAVIGNKNVLLVRLKEVEDVMREQHEALEQMYNERTELVEGLKQHQIELELQARDLSVARESSEENRQKYQDLYDLAPVGYLTLDAGGNITEVNLTMARMLGVERGKLIGTPFSRYISPESQGTWHLFKTKITAFKEKGQPELLMKRQPDSRFYALLDASAVPDGENDVPLRLVLTDISAKKKAEEELRKYQEHLEELVEERTRKLKELARQLVDNQEQVQTTIGNELHDEVGQLLTYTALLLDRNLKKQDQKMIEEAREIVSQVLSQVRNMSSMLSPRLLRSQGLSEALYSLIDEFRQRTGIAVTFTCPHECVTVPEDTALAVYRIIQEALTNITRHAQATETEVRITDGGNELRLEITDNGVGFDPAARTATNGLAGMKERAMAMGGECSIVSKTGKGTRVTARIPLDNREDSTEQ